MSGTGHYTNSGRLSSTQQTTSVIMMYEIHQDSGFK